MNIRQHIPNALTILNLTCGMVSVVYTLEGDPVGSGFFILLAALFDFLDGMAARALKAFSVIGKELDSLADVVSFGVAPGILVYRMLAAGCEGSCNVLEQLQIAPYFALLIPVLSAIRLAKFNTDTRQEDHFIGLPTPANAMFFASVPLVVFLQPRLFSVIPTEMIADFLGNTRVLTVLTIFFSFLLVSDFPMLSLKIKSFDWKENRIRYILLLALLVLVFLFSLAAIPLIIVLYLVLSVFFQRNT